MKNPSSKLTRMRLDLEEYDFSIEYIKGKCNVLADALSRITLDTTQLKSIYAITRSMVKKNETADRSNPTEQEPDQLHVYEAMNNAEAFELPKLSFMREKSILKIKMFNKKYSRLIQELVLKLTKENEETILKQVFQIINKEAPGRILDTTFNKCCVNKTFKLALSKDDYIFSFFDINIFKQTGNDVLRNVTIIIYEKPRVLTNHNQITEILT